jgi:DNA-directed RNA polymerase specialized sigma subunit
MSRLQQTQAAIFERVEDKLTEVMQRKPRIHEIEWACRLKPGQSSYLHIVSLALRDSSSLADKVASTDNADHVELSAVLHDDCGIDPSEEAQARDLRTTLLDSSRNTRDRQVISDYLSGLSFVEVGKRHQISESRASQLVQRWRAIVKETWLKLTGEELDLSHCIKVKHGPIRHSKIKDHRVARKMPQIQPRELEELQSLAV